jgi:hypothetical protein
MKELRCTLLTDGSSDRALIPILKWLLRACGVNGALSVEWADLARLPKPPRTLAERIVVAVDLYPCDLLLVHRDAENVLRDERVKEIMLVLQSVNVDPATTVPVVPVRMSETWLLIDLDALRLAAGNPLGTTPLSIPPLAHLEEQPQPKELLYRLLQEASGLRGRKLKKFRPNALVHRLADLINDFAPLRRLPAFRALEENLGRVIADRGWV